MLAIGWAIRLEGTASLTKGRRKLGHDRAYDTRAGLSSPRRSGVLGQVEYVPVTITHSRTRDSCARVC